MYSPLNPLVVIAPHELKINLLIFKESPLRGEGPLTRPSDDLPHKGRGVHTASTSYDHMIDRWLIMGKDTSPLVGEVVLLRSKAKAKGRVRGIISSLPTSPTKGWWIACNDDRGGNE